MGARRPLTLHRVVELAGERPDELAMLDVDGRSLTWSVLHEESLRWAAMYRELGVRAGDTVVTMVPGSVESYLAWLGLAWLHAIEVPANAMFVGQSLRHLINDSGANMLVLAGGLVDRLPPIAHEIRGVDRVAVLGDDASFDLPFPTTSADALLAASDPAWDLEPPSVWDTAALIYTSGTTGRSKGVLAPWGEFAEAPGILPPDFIAPGKPFYSMFPPFHLSGKTSLVAAVDRGAYLLVREKFSASAFWDDIRRHDVTSASLIGPIIAMLLASPVRPDDADNPLERILTAPLDANLEAFQKRFGVPHVCTGYGMSEIGTPIVSGWDPPINGSCGRARSGGPGYEVRLVDEHDHPVPPGTPGELLVRSAEPWALNAGYWQLPEETARAWRNGWFHTGDVFVEDAEGWLFFVDRLKDALRRRGENISSFEVEAHVLEHPSVAEAAVVGVPGELGDDEVMVFVVVHDGHDLLPHELDAFLGPRIPAFMRPRYVDIVDELPKTDATFRVKKHELRARGVAPSTWDREAATP